MDGITGDTAPRIEMTEKQAKLTHDGREVVEYSIETPRVSGAVNMSAELAFNRYYTLQAQSLITYNTGALLRSAVMTMDGNERDGGLFSPFVFRLTCHDGYVGDRYVSVFFDRYESKGGAHGATTRSSDTWDFDRAGKAGLADLFTPGSDYMRPLMAGIRARAEEMGRGGTVDFYDGLDKNLTDYFDAQNFYLSKIGIVIYYQEYTIAPYAAGILEFTTPFAAFADMLVYRELALQIPAMSAVALSPAAVPDSQPPRRIQRWNSVEEFERTLG